MKSEPDGFGIHDLERVRAEPWTGVRNYQARNSMRDDMSVGDPVLFYHSNAKPSGVAGLARVSRTGVTDRTQFDPKSEYYDPKAREDAPTWICVEVEFVQRFATVISLEALRSVPALTDMILLRKGTRLSVLPVTAVEFEVIRSMAEGP